MRKVLLMFYFRKSEMISTTYNKHGHDYISITAVVITKIGHSFMEGG